MMMNSQQVSATVTRYLDMLGLTPEEPTEEFLKKMMTAHLSTFPFENISKFFYFKKQKFLPSIKEFLNHYQRFQFGGTCYILNSNFYQLLQALGYNCRLIMLSDVHMGVLVQLKEYPGEELYADVGSAMPLFQPLRFEKEMGNKIAFGNEKVVLQRDEESQEKYRYLFYRDGKLVSENPWVFEPAKTYQLNDFSHCIQTSYLPDSTFMKILRCQLWQPERNRSLSLVNDRLTIRYRYGRKWSTKLSSVYEVIEVLKDEFELPDLPVHDAIQVLHELGVNVFDS